MKPKFMALAKKISQLSDHPQHRHGAVITRGNSVVSVGANKIKTHPRSSHPHRSTHAELSAVIRANRVDLLGSTAYVYREKKDGSAGLSKPCRWCHQLLVESGVKDVYYSSETGNRYESL